jgi:hypothetical protein
MEGVPSMNWMCGMQTATTSLLMVLCREVRASYALIFIFIVSFENALTF